MIISPGRGYVFVHIPKTGGTSMAMALEERAMKDDILIGDTPKAIRRRGRAKKLKAPGRLWKHSTLRDIDGLVDLSGMLVFTLVRNPWDRLVSYYHWLQDQTFDHPAVHLAKQRSFVRFLNDKGTKATLLKHPYTSYVAHPDVPRPVYVRLEHLRDDLQPIEEHLGFSLELPVANRSERRREWQAYYTDADAALVGQLCGPDASRFGYTFAG